MVIVIWFVHVNQWHLTLRINTSHIKKPRPKDEAFLYTIIRGKETIPIYRASDMVLA